MIHVWYSRRKSDDKEVHTYSTSLSDWGEVNEVPEMGNTRLSCEAISAPLLSFGALGRTKLRHSLLHSSNSYAPQTTKFQYLILRPLPLQTSVTTLEIFPKRHFTFELTQLSE